MEDRPIAVIDLDGVLADVRHRLRHLEGTRKDWVAFFAGIPADEVLPEGRAVAERLNRHRLPRGELIMRHDGDRRPARVTKPALLRRYVAAGRRVAVIVDDDLAVCDTLEKQGWPVLRADWMGRPAALDQAQEGDGRT